MSVKVNNDFEVEDVEIYQVPEKDIKRTREYKCSPLGLSPTTLPSP